MVSFVKKCFKFRPVYISIPIVAAGIVAYLIGIPFLDLMELKTVDLRFVSRGEIEPGPDVVMAVIHEKSLAAEGKWPWPRTRIAELISKLDAAGAKVIALDILFLEPSGKVLLEALEIIERTARSSPSRDTKTVAHIQELKKKHDTDQRLADAIKGSNARVILGYFFQTDAPDGFRTPANGAPIDGRNIRGSMYTVVRNTSKRTQDSPGSYPRSYPRIEAVGPRVAIPVISESSPYAGFLNMKADKDGVIRWIPGVISFQDELYAPLCLTAAGAYLDTPVSLTVSAYGIDAIRIGNRRIPTDEIGRMLINYRGKEKTFPHVPVTDILNGRVPDRVFKDKVVLVGVTAAGIFDMRVTPFDTVFPGLEIHANMIDTILSWDFLWQTAQTAVFDMFAILVAGLFVGVVCARAGALTGALTVAATFPGYILFCQYLFSSKGWILNLVYPLTVVVFVYLGTTVYRYLTVARERRFIRDAFSTYLAPSVVKQLEESPEKLVLGGEQREITAFFSDIQGFTRISENLTPRALVDLLNELLTEMTDIILRCEGTVDKFEGDAIIAFFGAPNDLDNHAAVACRACIDMQNRLTSLRQAWAVRNKPELKMRIGLCTGPAVVGNMGSRNRMDYTMMGDTVNTASRLEGANKAYGVFTLISESTQRELDSDILSREIDSVNLVGKENPVAIHEVVGYSDTVDSRLKETLTRYATGLSAYRNRQWANAITHFQSALALTPDDGPSKTLIERCQRFTDSPPPQNWDGSHTLEAK